MSVIRNACSGSKLPSRRFAATNSIDPANMVRLIIIGYQKLNPETFIYIPYARPINQNPANMGMVCGKAALNALPILRFLPASILLTSFL